MVEGYNIYGKSAATPFQLLRAGAHAPQLSGIASTLYAESWYFVFVLPVNSVRPIDLPGNVSVVSSAKVAQTTSDLSKLVPSGAVIGIVVRTMA